MAKAYLSINGRIDTFVTGFNDLVDIIGDKAALNTTEDSDIVGAINSLYALIDSDLDFRSKISVTDAGGDGSLSYSSGTGIITYTGPSATEVRAHVSVTDAGGDGSLSYNSTSGVLTYTGPSASEVRAHFSAGGDLAYNSSTGEFSFTDSAQRSDAYIRGLISVTDAGGDGSLSYNSGTGAITYTGPSASEVRAHLSAGEGIDFASGIISGENATTSNKGIASFSSTNFSVSSGAVSIANDGVARANLKDEVGLVIYNSSGTPLKTLYGAGS